MRKYGWQKIVGVESLVETALRESGVQSGLYTEVTVFEAVQILTDEGNVYEVLPRHSEDAVGLAAYYRQRGWTDSRCH